MTRTPRGNGQIERLHTTMIPILLKFSINDPNKWYKYVEGIQRTINAITSRSICKILLETMTGLKIQNKEAK